MGVRESLFESVFTSEFDINLFISFSKEFFNDIDIVRPDKFMDDGWNWSEFNFYIKGYYHIGNFAGSDKKRIAVFAVELKDYKNIDRARSMQRNFIKKLMNAGNLDGSIVAFYADGETKWRLSFVRLDYEFAKGKVIEKLTPAKRYSYLVGKGEPCHTAQERLFPIFNNIHANPTIDEIEDAFSVEKVTKEFFEKYKEKYFQVKEHLDANEDFVDEAKRRNFTSEQFAKKLMGQIAFLYFVQKKGWLGVNAIPKSITSKEYKDAFYSQGRASKEVLSKAYRQVSDDYKLVSINNLTLDEEITLSKSVKGMPWGTGPKDFMRQLFITCNKQGKNFFDDYLEPLFYEALNENRGDSGYFTKLHCRVPFLNGGLFEPLDNYDWNHNDFSLENEIFSNRDIKGERDADGILDIFDRYNFTMNEDEPLEREVAIDPEMLGKIFENLLDAKDRKSKGAFYTPREIVHYMCQESITNYLVNQTELPYDDIKDFIIYGEHMKDEDTSHLTKMGLSDMLISDKIYDRKNGINRLSDIDNALSVIKVADPAVGSGAFPLGMVSEIVKIRKNISAYLALDMNDYQKSEMYRQYRHPLKLKLDTIKNSIFAVDIEASAVDITKLRLWLSLVVEQQTNENCSNMLDMEQKNPMPLPNLDCNICCGNSLIDEFEGIKLVNESDLFGAKSGTQILLGQNKYDNLLTQLFEAQDKLFYEKNHQTKDELKRKIRNIIDTIIMFNIGDNAETVRKYNEIKDSPSLPYFLWELEFARVFKEKGGFDVVIGNPPYIGFHNVPNKEYFRHRYYSANGKYDFYVLFIEQALNLVREHGYISYICPSYFYKRDYGKKLRNLILENTCIKFIADFNDSQIFDSATTYTCIFGFEKNNKNSNNDIIIVDKDLTYGKIHKINQKSLKEPIWMLEDSASMEDVNKIVKKCKLTLGTITKSISQGIVTGNNSIYILNEKIILERQINYTYLKPVFKGKNIRNKNIIHDGEYLFYPYELDANGRMKLIDEMLIQQNNPNLYAYLLENKNILLEREYFLKSNKKWYELWNPRRLEHFYARKFVFSEVNYKNEFVLTDECFYSDSACGAELKDEYKIYEAYIEKYLNSEVVSDLFKKISVPKANGYLIYKNAFLKDLPVYLPDNIKDIFKSLLLLDEREFQIWLETEFDK